MNKQEIRRILIVTVLLILTVECIYWYEKFLDWRDYISTTFYVELKYVSQLNPVDFSPFMGVSQVNKNQKDTFSGWSCISSGTITANAARNIVNDLLPNIDEDKYGIVLSFGRKIVDLFYNRGSMVGNEDFYFPMPKGEHAPIAHAVLGKDYYPETIFVYTFEKDSIQENAPPYRFIFAPDWIGAQYVIEGEAGTLKGN